MNLCVRVTLDIAVLTNAVTSDQDRLRTPPLNRFYNYTGLQ